MDTEIDYLGQQFAMNSVADVEKVLLLDDAVEYPLGQ